MLSDHDAREDLKKRGIKSIPVTIVDGSDVIIGYYPKKLVQSLKLDTSVDLSAGGQWLADKYGVILGAAVRAVNQASLAQLDQTIPWRPQTLRSLMLHVISFPELAYRAHETGHMTPEDMQASNQRLSSLTAPGAIAEYGEEVRRDLAAFLQSGNTAAFERVVPAHYGGEVTVMELPTSSCDTAPTTSNRSTISCRGTWGSCWIIPPLKGTWRASRPRWN